MSAEYRIPSWAIVTIATLLFTACNPITAEPDIATSVPTPLPTPEREPMQASLYDFADFFAKYDGSKIEPERYAETILDIVDCIMEDEDFVLGSDQYTPGQQAAGQWVNITVLMIFSELVVETAPEETDPEFYSSLKKAHTACMADE